MHPSKKILSVILMFLISQLMVHCIDKQANALSPEKILEYNRDYSEVQFAKLLKSENKTTILNAIRSMGRIQDPESRAIILSLLKNNDPEILGETIFAAGQLPPDTLLENILIQTGLANSDAKIQKRITMALAKIGTQRSEFYILQQLKNDHWRNRESAAIACGLIFRRKKIVFQKGIPALFEIIDAGDSASWAGAYAINQMGLPTQLKEVGHALKKTDENASVYLLRAIYKMIQRLSDKKIQEELGQKAYQKLVQSARDKQLWTAIEKTKNSLNWRVRREYAKLIGQINPSKHTGQLIKLTNDPQIHVKLAAYEGLHGVNNNKKVDAIILDGIKSKDANIAASNIANYVIQKKEKALDSLKIWWRYGPLLKRLAAVSGLAELNSPQAYELLAQISKTSNRFIQIEAIDAMSEFEIKKNTDFLEGLKSDNPPVVSISALTLAKMNDSSAVEPLIQTFSGLNKESTIETAQDVLNSIIKLNPKMETEKWMKIADRKIPQTYNIIRAHLAKGGVELAKIPFSKGLKVFNDKEEGLPVRAVIQTNRGRMILALFPHKAPQNVANFYHLAKKGFYKNLLFHRVVSDFVIQGGDPDSTGWGGPGYSIVDEYSPLPFERGTVGIATAGKDTGGCQFFICHSRQPHLDGRYTVFGKILEGYDILDKIEQGDRIIDITM